MTSKNRFTWVQTHKELAEYLKGKEDEQKELVDLLREAGVTAGLVDEEPIGNRFDLEEIDPFSFFCFIYKYGPDKKLKILQNIATELDLHYPEDGLGIPSAQAQKVMMFPFKEGRNNNEIENLWQFFYSALDDSITDEQFESILNQYGVGPVKITEALFYIDPENYFPIDGPTKPYLKEVLDIEPTFSTWQEYLDLLEKVKEKEDTPFYELSYEAYLWNNEQKKTNYWVFQCNPEKFDVIQVLKSDELNDWTVDAHKDKIKEGDKVILWVTGKQAGCYALCETTSNVYEDTIEVSHKDNTEELTNRVDLKVTHNLVDAPIIKNRVEEVDELSDLNVGHQGTNFTATEEEYNALLNIAEDNDEYRKWIRLQETVNYIDSESAVRKFFFSVKYLIEELGLDENHPKLYAAAVDYYLHLTIGGKYLTFVQFKKDNLKLAFHVERTALDTLNSIYPDLEYDDGYSDSKSDTIFVKIDPNQEISEILLEATKKVGHALAAKYSKSSYRSIYPEVYNPWIIRVAQSDELLERLLNNEKPNFMKPTRQLIEVNYPLNTIFYGPPGTGKTYSTLKRAAEIVEGREIDDYGDAKQIFNDRLGDTIEFITFHQNYSYEDFIQGLRPDTEHDNELTFNRVDGVFKTLADKALKNYKASKHPQPKKKAFEEVFSAFIEPLVEGEVEELEVEMKRVSYYITAVTNRSIEFRKDSGGTAHTLSIDTLKRMYEAESPYEKRGLGVYYNPLLNKLLDRGRSPGEIETVEEKNYVLIIDEINRANISRVFGELITLIEPDKRFGREMHIPAKLPSSEMLSVPENLYIIGTMNTADKSIALLDIALRRRFEFEAMYPKYEIIGEVIHDVDVLKKINERIIKLKGHDFQIGHSYFMKNHVTLKQRMNRRVIPLLLEYFMNDEEEVKKILEHAGLTIKENTWPLEITGKA